MMSFDLTALKMAAPAFLQAGRATFEGGAGDSVLWMLLQTLLVLGFVCGLAYVIFRWALPRLAAVRSSRSMVRIVDVVGLDARKRLYVIEVTGRWLLVAASEAGVQLVSELDAATAEEAARLMESSRPTWKGVSSTARETFADRLTRLMKKRR